MEQETRGMKVFKDDQVDFPLFIIKDFFEDPDFYRNVLLNAKENNQNGNFIGKNLDVDPCFYDSTAFYVLNAASQILNDYTWIPVIGNLIHFRRQTDSNESSILATHTDRFEFLDFDQTGRSIFSNYMHWSFIVTLTPAEKQGSLCFCENIKTGERLKQIKYRQDIEKEEVWDCITNHDEWKIWKEVYYEYNSAIMFPSHFWHTALNIKCSKEHPRTMFTAWFYSGFNSKYNKCGIDVLDKQ